MCFFCGKNWSKSCIKIGPGFALFFQIYNVYWGMFTNTNSVNWCPNSFFLKIVGMSKMRFLKRNCIFFVFVLFYVEERKTEKRRNTKRKKAKEVFLRWSSKMWRMKNGFLAKCAWHYLCQEGRKNGIFVHTICFGQNVWAQNNQTQEKYTNRGFSGNSQKPKMTPFCLKKVCLGMGEQVVLLTVFWKSCALLKTLFL